MKADTDLSSVKALAQTFLKMDVKSNAAQSYHRYTSIPADVWMQTETPRNSQNFIVC